MATCAPRKSPRLSIRRYPWQNRHTVKSLLVSTPRSRRSRSIRKRKLAGSLNRSLKYTDSTGMATNERGWLQSLVDGVNSDDSLKHRSLAGPGGKWLEITPADSKMDALLGPVDEARMTVSLTTRVYQLYVLYPIPRPVEQYIGKLLWWHLVCQ